MSDIILDHRMTDIEVLSEETNAVIVSIACVKFSMKTSYTESFCVNINPASSKALGLHISKDTLNWWKKQKPEALKSWMHSRINLPDALDQFIEFCGTYKNTIHWAQGIAFDFPILDSSLKVCGKTPPWKYWNVYDARTANYLGAVNPFDEPRVGQYHSALDDCYTQIQNLKKAIGITHE